MTYGLHLLSIFHAKTEGYSTSSLHQYPLCGRRSLREGDAYEKVKQTTRMAMGAHTYEMIYGPNGNRMTKKYAYSDTVKTLYYTRDPKGNILSVYQDSVSGDTVKLYVQKEIPVYASSRVANYGLGRDMIDTTPPMGNFTRIRSLKEYELSNHLGNVLTTVTDRHLGQGTGKKAEYFTAEVRTASDYYPFGFRHPGRKKRSKAYRFAFNGKEQEAQQEYGDHAHYDYGFRIYNPAIGRFLSVDPLAEKYVWVTPYNFAENSPIANIDLWGLQKWDMTHMDDNFKGATRKEIQRYRKESTKYAVAVVGGVVADFTGEAVFGYAFKAFAATKLGGKVIGATSKFVGKTYSALKRTVGNSDDAARKIDKVTQLSINANKGAEFEKQVFEEIKKNQIEVVEQITIKTKSGTKTRLDFVGKSKSGKIKLTEAKSSQKAPLTKNQKNGFPEIAKDGGTVVGKGKGNFPGGTKIPPTKVDIIRPK